MAAVLFLLPTRGSTFLNIARSGFSLLGSGLLTSFSAVLFSGAWTGIATFCPKPLEGLKGGPEGSLQHACDDCLERSVARRGCWARDLPVRSF